MKHRNNSLRLPIACVVIALLALLVAACSSDDSDRAQADETDASGSASSASSDSDSVSQPADAETGEDTSSEQLKEPEEAEPEFRTIEHVGGTTDVPADPQNILALDEYSAYIMWELGFEPAAVYGSFETIYTEPVAAAMGVELTEHLLASPSFEASAALAPDLIVGTNHPSTLEMYDLWSEAGPMFLYADSASWQEQLALVGEALSAEDIAAERTAALEAEIVRVAAEIDAAFDTPPTVSIFGSAGGSPFAVPDMLTTSAALLDQLGLDRPEAQRAEVDPGFPLIFFSEENLLDHDADFVFVLADGGFYGDGMSDLPLFSSLTGTTTNISGEFWLGTFPFAVSWILADLEAVLLGKGEARIGADVADHWNAYTG